MGSQYGTGFVGLLDFVSQVAGFGDSYIRDGDEVFCREANTAYVYRLSFAAPDGTSIIKGTWLPGAWVRNPVPGAPVVGGTPFASFFALMPGDNAATVAVGAPVLFPQNGPTNGTATRLTSSTFNLPVVGVYEISWQVSVSEAGQLQVAIGGVGVANTVVGRATGTSQIVGKAFITTVAANSVLSIINPVGNSTALTITPIAGGASAVSATLSIKRFA